MAHLPKGQGVFLPPFKAWLASNIPAVYDNTMTYYEELCALIKYLQDIVVPALNNNAAAITTISTAVEQLQKYVDDYFKNLNVQEEINNKLDQMAEDGTLGEIINAYLSVDETINFSTLFASTEYLPGSTYSMQGGCVMDDGNIVQFYGTGQVRKISPNGTVLLENSHEVGHCNGVTFCNKDNKIYVVSGQNDETGRKVYVFNSTTLELENTIDVSESFPDYCYGIVYVPEKEQFIFGNWWAPSRTCYLWVTDLEFNVVETKSYNFKVNTTSNICRFGKNYIGVDVLTSHTMLLFDLDTLAFNRQININEMVSDVWCITEQEWYDYRNEKIYIGFVAAASVSPGWGGGTHIYGVCDLNKNYISTSRGVLSPSSEKYYVNHSATPALDRNGTSSKPFMNIYEALNSSLRTERTTGFVTIIIQDSPSDRRYSPVFSMDKTYSIEYTPNETITFFQMIGVNECSKVRINRAVTLYPLSPKANIFNWGDGGDLIVMGELSIYGTVSNSDDSRVVLNGGDGAVIKAAFNNNGADLKDYWGNIYDTDSVLRANSASSPLFANIHTTLTGSTFKQEIHGVKMVIQADGDGKYFVPAYAKCGIVIPKFSLTYDGASVIHEEPIPWSANVWGEKPYFDDNGKHVLTIDTSGEIKISNNVTLTRVRFITQ